MLRSAEPSTRLAKLKKAKTKIQSPAMRRRFATSRRWQIRIFPPKRKKRNTRMGIPNSAKKSADIEPYSLRAANALRLALRAMLRERRNARGATFACARLSAPPRCGAAQMTILSSPTKRKKPYVQKNIRFLWLITLIMIQYRVLLLFLVPFFSIGFIWYD